MSKTVLITGATGKQGGAVINALLAANADFQILGLTRDVHSASAQRLANKSPKIKLISGNLNEPKAIFKQVKEISPAPVWGVFSVQAVIGAGGSEEKQGKDLIDAAIANNVRHFVYTSVDRGGDQISDSNQTNVPHFITKYKIEQHLFAASKATPMTWTVLRPVAFMENLVPGFFGKLFATAFDTTLVRGDQRKSLQLIASSDIGFFGAQAFLQHDSEQYKNQSISLAGDELTYPQFRDVFKKTTGQEMATTYSFLAWFMLWMMKDLGLMFSWFRDQGYGADIGAVRQMKPDLKDFKTWLETESGFRKDL